MKKLLFTFLLGLTASAAFADNDSLNRCRANGQGWWDYECQKQLKKPPEQPPEQPQPQPQPTETPKEKENPCLKKETWTASCGFINPGKDFAFQEKQRDALMQAMVMSNNDPKSVENFQYYMKWVLERASEVANLWYFNMTQNPELDPSVQQPVSSFGLRLMTEVQKGHADEIYKALQNENAILIYFTRSDCQFCHSMMNNVKRLAKVSGLPVYNASLDGACIPGLEKQCRTAEVSQKPAELLQVTIVPTLFLYIGPNTWIRISTGVTDESTLQARLVSFFSAYRNALLKGVSNGYNGRASVDFNGTEAAGTNKGVAGASGAGMQLPSEADMKSLLSK